MAVFGERCVDLNNDALKIFGTHFSYNEKLKKEKIFKTVTGIQRVLEIWRKRNLTLERKLVIFKTMAISKIVFKWFIKHVSELEKIQKAFFLENSAPKIKYETSCNDYNDGGLKMLIFQTKL